MPLIQANSKFPVRKLPIPTALKKFVNGKIPDELMGTLKCKGKMYRPAAHCFNLMYAEAAKAKIKFVNSGDYRTLERQEAMFFERYGLKDEGRNVTRKYKGKTWYLKKGFAPSAVPQTSPHGWGLAIDIDVSNPKTFDWLCENAPKYGFFLQGKPTTLTGKPNPEYEPWHWNWCGGDKTPQFVAALDAMHQN